MTTQVFRAGQDTDAMCGKCGLLLAHVIHAVGATGKPARVECKTCGAIHGYRSGKPSSRTPSGRTGTRTASSRVSPAAAFDALMAGKDISNPVRYTIRESFEVDAVLDHKKFGLGIVTQVLGDDKIEVAFRDGAKTLVHNR